MLTIKDATDEQLLEELILRNGVAPAPIKIQFNTDFLEVLVGIGDDNTAKILLSTDDRFVLDEMVRNAKQKG